MLFQDLSDNGLPQSNFHLEDVDLANVISLSLQVLELSYYSYPITQFLVLSSSFFLILPSR